MSIAMDPAAKFVADIAAGKVIRYGAVLKDTGTGQIVGHLKETGEMGSILSNLFSSPLKLANAANPLGFVTDAIGHGINAYQIRGVKKSVDEVKAIVEGLQLVTNIGAVSSVAGLGVSVAGFVAINHKLNKIDTKIDGIADDIGLIKAVLSELSISWESMSEAQFQTAAETLIVAEKSETSARKLELAKEAVSRFSLLKNYYSQLLRRKGFYDDAALDIECVYEIVSRYTVSCMGVLQAEFLTGDLGSYGTRLDTIINEYRALATFSPKQLYLSRCDQMDTLNLEIDHQLLSNSLVGFSRASLENAARLDSYQSELKYIESNNISVYDYLNELRNHETDIVLLPHQKESKWTSLRRFVTS